MILEWLKSFLYGIVEGVTEWLPISSTGHLILLDSFFSLDLGEDFVKMFDVVIQFGSILAIVVLYFRRLNPFALSKTKDEKQETWGLWLRIIVAAVPAGIIGLLFDDFFDRTVFSDPQRVYIVAGALLVYGVVLIIAERKNKGRTFRVDKVKRF